MSSGIVLTSNGVAYKAIRQVLEDNLERGARLGYIAAARWRPLWWLWLWFRRWEFRYLLDVELVLITERNHLKEFPKIQGLIVEGGSTDRLMIWLRRHELVQLIRNYVLGNCGVYVGISAGSIAAGPTLRPASWVGDWRPEVRDETGLELICYDVQPHTHMTYLNDQVYHLADGAALVLLPGGSPRLVGANVHQPLF